MFPIARATVMVRDGEQQGVLFHFSIDDTKGKSHYNQLSKPLANRDS